jgi:hypothetical protein
VRGGLDCTVVPSRHGVSPRQGFDGTEAYAMAGGLGMIRSIAVGRLWAGIEGRQLVTASVEGGVHIFDLSGVSVEPSQMANKGELTRVLHGNRGEWLMGDARSHRGQESHSIMVVVRRWCVVSRCHALGVGPSGLRGAGLQHHVPRGGGP